MLLGSRAALPAKRSTTRKRPRFRRGRSSDDCPGSRIGLERHKPAARDIDRHAAKERDMGLCGAMGNRDAREQHIRVFGSRDDAKLDAARGTPELGAAQGQNQIRPGWGDGQDPRSVSVVGRARASRSGCGLLVVAGLDVPAEAAERIGVLGVEGGLWGQQRAVRRHEALLAAAHRRPRQRDSGSADGGAGRRLDRSARIDEQGAAGSVTTAAASPVSSSCRRRRRRHRHRHRHRRQHRRRRPSHRDTESADRRGR